MMRIFVASIAGALLFSVGSAAECVELKVLSANGVQTVIEDLAPKFERATGHKLVTTFATGGAAVKRVQDGELVDVVIAPDRGIADLAKAGRVGTDTVTPFASTGISVAVRIGAPKPDISLPEALRRALLDAKSITYLNPADGGASGIHFAKVLDRLGIANEMKLKTVFAPKTGAVGEFVASGAAELGVIQYPLLFSVPGIEIVGPLPGDLQNTIVFSGAILVGATNIPASRMLVNFLRSPEAAAVLRAKGMEPGPP